MFPSLLAEFISLILVSKVREERRIIESFFVFVCTHLITFMYLSPSSDNGRFHQHFTCCSEAYKGSYRASKVSVHLWCTANGVLYWSWS